MAAQYSNRQFFRKTPNLYLSKFFEAKGIQLDVNINRLKEHDADVFQVALNYMRIRRRVSALAKRLFRAIFRRILAANGRSVVWAE